MPGDRYKRSDRIDRPAVPIATSDKVLHGRVRRIKREGGYGFIQVDGDITEYFFHLSTLVGGAELFKMLDGSDAEIGKLGTAVRFRAVATAKGARAVQVEVID